MQVDLDLREYPEPSKNQYFLLVLKDVSEEKESVSRKVPYFSTTWQIVKKPEFCVYTNFSLIPQAAWKARMFCEALHRPTKDGKFPDEFHQWLMQRYIGRDVFAQIQWTGICWDIKKVVHPRYGSTIERI